MFALPCSEDWIRLTLHGPPENSEQVEVGWVVLLCGCVWGLGGVGPDLHHL